MRSLLPALSIRTRLSALVFALLVIPYVGYRYVQGMEAFLRGGFEAALIGGAKALAGALHVRSRLFPEETVDGADLHAHPLATPPQLDGYANDWGGLVSRARKVAWADLPKRAGVDIALGRFEDHAYILIRVNDSTPASARSGDPLTADHIILRVVDNQLERHHYLLDTSESGPLQTFALLRDRHGQGKTVRELRIHGIARRTASGYNLEIRVPLSLLGPRLGVSVIDAPNAENGTRALAETAPEEAELGVLVLPSSDIADIIAALGSTPGRRIWVLDRHLRVLARGGALTRARPLDVIPIWFGWVLGGAPNPRFADPGPVERLDREESRAAIDGQSAIRWRDSANSGVSIVSAAHPVWAGTKVVGTVLVEESSQPIQTARSQALTDLFVTTLMVFVLSGVGLALFASTLSRRLRRLSREANSAIDSNGRVVGQVGTDHGRDEIGELADGFAQMLERLGQYNRYLERLAGRLSHELRTPLAVIRSSLDNLELDATPAADSQFLVRARGGVERLQRILIRMSEVTRIEEAVRNVDIDNIDVAALMDATIAAYRDTWPSIQFELDCDRSVKSRISGSADLLVQALDKLTANALDFASKGTPIRFTVTNRSDACVISVTNEGPELPKEMGSRLFESMVSVRDGGGDHSEPHLGLGLYIVALVAHSHGGSVAAHQHQDPSAVTMEIILPRLYPG
ncbi:MAG: HAMP domain-containing protein [Chromatiales bacterium]|nr:HAMP domain-containing protein [Chromatiales bacterium]